MSRNFIRKSIVAVGALIVGLIALNEIATSNEQPVYSRADGVVVNIITRNDNIKPTCYLKVSFFTRPSPTAKLISSQNTDQFLYAEIRVPDGQSCCFKPGQHVTILYRKDDPSIAVLEEAVESDSNLTNDKINDYEN